MYVYIYIYIYHIMYIYIYTYSVYNNSKRKIYLVTSISNFATKYFGINGHSIADWSSFLFKRRR